MKYYKHILFILLLLIIGLLLYLLFENGTDNQLKHKQTATVMLKDAAGVWLKNELEKEGIPLYSVDPGKKRKTVRYLTLADGRYQMEVDSLKDIRCLFTPEASENGCVRTLYMINEPAIEGLTRLWQERLNIGLSDYKCGLGLTYKFPNGKSGNQSAFISDAAFLSVANKLGDFYLDDMYYLKVAAYLYGPSVWRCADWKDFKIILCLVVIGISIILIVFRLNRKRSQHESNELLPIIPDVKPADIVCCIADGEYQIGEILWNENEDTITFRGKVVNCSEQPSNLLSAFIREEGYFLSNTQISKICNWNPGDIGVGRKRRTAMFNLRRLLMSEKSHVFVEAGKNELKENGYYLLIKE